MCYRRFPGSPGGRLWAGPGVAEAGVCNTSRPQPQPEADPPPAEAYNSNGGYGPLAQLVEQLTLNQLVPGSSPGRLTTLEAGRWILEVRSLSPDSGHRAPARLGGRGGLSSFPLLTSTLQSGEVSELADEHDLGSCAARRGSSSLPFPTSRATPVPGLSINIVGLQA